MSYHLLQRRIEKAAGAYLVSEIPGLTTVYASEDTPVISAVQTVHAFCPTAEGNSDIPGNYGVTLTVELRTILTLYSNRATAVTAHFDTWGTIADAMMQDDLSTGLASTAYLINGIQDANQLSQSNENGTLKNSITRIIHAAAITSA